jgi:hypothetical protein
MPDRSKGWSQRKCLGLGTVFPLPKRSTLLVPPSFHRPSQVSLSSRYILVLRCWNTLFPFLTALISCVVLLSPDYRKFSFRALSPLITPSNDLRLCLLLHLMTLGILFVPPQHGIPMLYPESSILCHTVVQILCFWTLSIILFLSKNTVLFVKDWTMDNVQ